jgi:hypothetical protein
MRGVDEAEDAVLHQIPKVDRMGHGRRHPSSQRLDKRQRGRDPILLRFHQRRP